MPSVMTVTETKINENNQRVHDINICVDQACLVKMAGYWPSYFFECLWNETKSRSINTHKKNEANIQPS